MIDITTVLGFIVGFGGLVTGILLEGGNLGSYVGVSAAAIILGGTVGAVLISFPMSHIALVPRLFVIAFTEQKHNIPEVIKKLVGFSERARREGILCLESELANTEDEFLKSGLQLVIDGTDPALVRDTLETKIAFIAERHHEGASVIEAAGGYSPTMGIIGTVLGLINVLSNIADPSQLAGAIALAFIATLYGIMTANLIWLPLANKLKMKHTHEQLVKHIMLEGILSLQSGDNPRIVEQKLKAFLARNFAKNITAFTK
jgi:chemotaxis protein MotA